MALDNIPDPAQDHPNRSNGSAPPGAEGAAGAATELRDFLDAVADKVEKRDPVVDEVRGLLERRIASGDVDLPRHPDSASRILDLAKNPDASMKDILRQVRTDAALAGRILEVANSAAYAGSQNVYNLKMAVVRLGLTRVGELALEMSGATKHFQKDKRSNMLARIWKFSLATGFACEALAKSVPSEQEEGAFLTGLFHDVASPLVVQCIGRLERSGTIPPQADSRVLGILNAISGEFTERLVGSWNVPKASLEAIHLQHAKVRERRGKPLAHLLVCGKAVAAELGMGVRPVPLDYAQCRDFHFVGLEDERKVEPAREAVIDKVIQLSRK
ncbi:MAG: HD family phosphohydrolase [Gemmatimonadota bacterium]|nr:MAG: HD family phosphohydrolase [Gemmatimonadota bacterium]